MAEYLTIEDLSQILKYLPIKSLLRFRSVCKLWYSLIGSPDFISLHLHHNQHNNVTYTILFKQDQGTLVRKSSCNPNFSSIEVDRKKGVCTIFSHNHNNNNNNNQLSNPIYELELPFQCHGFYFIIMGCINGLVALWDGVDGGPNTVILWNPASKKCITLPNPESEPHLDFCDFDGWDLWFGFGYEATSNDYKIVRVLFFYEGSPRPAASKVDVFSCKSNFWRTVRTSPPFRVLGFGETRAYQPVHLNGVVHWLTAEPFIVTFDFENEVFGEIMWPSGLEPKDEGYDKIVAYGSKLSLIHKTNNNQMDIWVMKEYGVVESWAKLFVLDLDRESIEGCRNVVGFTSNKGLVLAGNSGHIEEVSEEDVEKPHVIELEREEETNWTWHVDTHLESLLLIEGAQSLPL